jgi:hypothetical protein
MPQAAYSFCGFTPPDSENHGVNPDGQHKNFLNDFP